MAERDYELEWARDSVTGMVDGEIVRALLVGPPGSHDGTLVGAVRQIFGRTKRDLGMTRQCTLVLTPDRVQLFACAGTPPRAKNPIGTWPCASVRLTASAAAKDSMSAVHPGVYESQKYYILELTVPGRTEPVVLECIRSNSSRATIEAIEDATGSPPSKITARRRAKQHKDGADEDDDG